MIGQMSIVGGQQAFMMNYFRYIDKSRYHVDFLGVHGTTSPYAKEIEKAGGELFYWNHTFGFKELAKSVKKLMAFIKKGRYDVVHSNIYIGNCWFLFAAKLAGVKVRISHSHCTFPLKGPGDGMLMGFYHAFVQKHVLLWSSTKLLACGVESGKALYSNRHFTVLNNSIDIEKYNTIDKAAQERLHKEFGIEKDTKVYASISRFDDNKNLTYVVEVYDQILKEAPGSLLIVGGAEPYDDSTHKAIEELIKRKGISNKVRVVTTRSDLRDIMQIVDCWLFPSFHEGLPIVGIELQAASVPIVASDSITKEMDMGLGLVHYLSLGNMSDWVTTCLNIKKKKQEIGLIREKFNEHEYNIEESVHILESFYTS